MAPSPARQRGGGTGPVLAMLGALLLPHLVGFEPRLDLVHYNLGRIDNLGGVYLALGQWQEARARFDRALELNPRNAAALHNRELLERRLGAR